MYPRDLIGYNGQPPHANWPNGARIAVQFVVNYEEGGENNILHGDKGSEAFLSEIIGAESWPNQRHMNMESIYEFGSRAGFWRVLDLFKSRNFPVTVFGIATAMARHPRAVQAMQSAGWELATHGLKWINYKDFSREEEQAHIDEAVRLHEEITGTRPLGLYQGRTSENTINLTREEGGFLYSADSYADDLPYWQDGLLMVPYTLDANDMRFATNQGFNTGEQFFTYLKDTFDVLYAEGETSPKMMSIGLHLRLVGRPGRFAALQRFVDYVKAHEHVWLATRLDIAKHWIKYHPPEGGYVPSRLSKSMFIEVFGDIFEHTPQIAAKTHEKGDLKDTAQGLHTQLVATMRAMDNEAKLALINAHPDLAGKLALAKELTADSTQEQAGVGLDRLNPQELAYFTHLNDSYKAKFGFPFIFAVKGKTKQDVLAAFETRILHAREEEFNTALAQIERIALLRLEARFALLPSEARLP
jgi:OHCU decarboxylase